MLAAVSDVDTAADRALLADALAAEGLPVDRVEVANDSVAALASGTGGLARGVACIAGTGSVVLALDGDGGEARAGGWGPPFGDGGSAYWIGFHAISRSLERYDEGRRDTALMRELLASAACPTLPELVYGHAGAAEDAANSTLYRSRVAGLARSVEAAALAGDQDAREIFRAAGAALGMTVSLALARIAMGAEPFDVVQVGGVWNARVPELLEGFGDALPTWRSQLRLKRPSAEPAVGAALLAAELSRSGRHCPGGLIPP